MKAIIWSKYNCHYCDSAKKFLDSRGIVYEEKRVGIDYTKEQLLEAVPNAKTVPQIFIDGEYVGGYTELVQKFNN